VSDLTLHEGMQGDEVRALQTEVIRFGFDLYASGADRVSGPNGRHTVRAFPRRQHLLVDGLAGENARPALPHARPFARALSPPVADGEGEEPISSVLQGEARPDLRTCAKLSGNGAKAVCVVGAGGVMMMRQRVLAALLS
jgi:peptidoglycan hydrolase-like protein with peptidoglycan-binding domain